MRDAILLLSVLITAIGGFGLFALSQPRNWAIAARTRPFPVTSVPALRWSGSLMLAISLLLSIWRDGPAFGPILWILLLALGGAIVVVILARRSSALGNRIGDRAD
jgi:hypothetical protein